MDKLTHYRASIHQILEQYASHTHSYGEIETQVLEDTTHDHYQVCHVGWHQDRRIHGCIVHLDIKPGNILKGKNNNYKLGDLGMARFLAKITADVNIPEGDCRYLA